jgi:CheY-like chemotaxis protein
MGNHPRESVDAHEVDPATVRVHPQSPTTGDELRTHVQETSPPPSARDTESFTTIEQALELPEQTFLKHLDARARRAELMGALLSGGGLSPESAIRALQAALGAVALSAADANLPPISRFAAALRTVMGHLGIATRGRNDAQIVDTLVFDESELSRDLVALAVESQGHTVRGAATYDDFVRELHDRKPGLIITEIELENAPAKYFCSTLRDLLHESKTPLVIFSELSEKPEFARALAPRRYVPKDLGVDGLILELADVYTEILAVRSTAAHARFQPPT